MPALKDLELSVEIPCRLLGKIFPSLTFCCSHKFKLAWVCIWRSFREWPSGLSSLLQEWSIRSRSTMSNPGKARQIEATETGKGRFTKQSGWFRSEFLFWVQDCHALSWICLPRVGWELAVLCSVAFLPLHSCFIHELMIMCSFVPAYSTEHQTTTTHK